MKKLNLSVVAFVFLGILSYGGGDIGSITKYETEDEYIAEEAGVEEEESYNTEVDEVEVSEPIITSEETISDEVEEEVVMPEKEEEIIISEPVVPSPTPISQTPIPTVVPTIAPTPIPKPPKMVAKPLITPNGMYVGLGITRTRYKDSCYCDTKSGRIKVENKDTTYGLTGRVGYDFNQYVGVEARASKTNWKGDGTRVGHIGAFVKPMVPVTDNTNVYGLVGVAKTKTKGSMPHVNTTALALGAGVEVDLSQDIPRNGRYDREFDGHGDQESGFGLFLDYERMVVKKDAPKLDSVSAGISYDF